MVACGHLVGSRCGLGPGRSVGLPLAAGCAFSTDALRTPSASAHSKSDGSSRRNHQVINSVFRPDEMQRAIGHLTNANVERAKAGARHARIQSWLRPSGCRALSRPCPRFLPRACDMGGRIPPQLEIPFVISVLGLFLLVGTLLGAGAVSESRARRALVVAAHDCSGVFANGRRVEDPSSPPRCFDAIGSFGSASQLSDGPSPSRPRSGPPANRVVIARDSVRANEFWVYRAGPNWHNDPFGQEAGRMTSADLGIWLRKHGS